MKARDRDEVSVVEDAEALLQGAVRDGRLKLPPGYYWEWSGQFENQVRALPVLRRRGVEVETAQGAKQSLKEPLMTDAIRLRILNQSDDGRGNYRACCQELEATETGLMNAR